MQSDWRKQKLILQQTIQLLNDQLQQSKKREEQHKILNEHLMVFVNQYKDQSEQLNKLTFENKELKKSFQDERKKHQYIQDHSQQQIKKLKQELAQKNRENQLLNLQNQKNIFQHETHISQFQVKVKEKNNKISKLEQKIHNLLLNPCLESENIHSKSTFVLNDLQGSTFRFGQQNQSRLSNLRKNRVDQYMKMEKNEIKVIVASLKNAKQKLDEGNHNISCLNEGSTQRISKTFYK